MEKSTEIKLVQKPIISHKLAEIGKNVTDRLESLNIDNQVATIDTVKSLKDLRADLNKELGEYESQRKLIKEGIASPYKEFEEIYKTEVSLKYEAAISKLKDKIDSVETKIKTEKKAVIENYFNELCASENIDFLKFKNLGVDINLSTTEKAYKEKCNEFIKKTVDDIALIKSGDFEAEITAEYKISLNVSQAITSVKSRKEREKQESDRLKQIENNHRISLIKGLGLVFMDMTNAYEYDAEIYISKDKVENLPKGEFNSKLIELEESIKVKKAEAKKDDPAKEEPTQETKKPAPAVSVPKVETKEETVTASFQVSGTMTQLRALGQYMKSNNITYKNI